MFTERSRTVFVQLTRRLDLGVTRQATPVTLTIHSHVAGATTSRRSLPVLVAGDTAWPDAADSLMTGVAPGVVLSAYTNTWKAGPAGAPAHRYAHPILHGLLDTVNAELVQLPVDCSGPSNTLAVPPLGAVVAVRAPVVVDELGTEDVGVAVVCDEDATDVVVPDDAPPAGGGSL